MRVIMEQAFCAEPKALFSIYTDPDFYHQRYRESGIADYRMERFAEEGEGFEVAIALEVGLQSEHIPAAFARKLGGRQPVRYQLSWSPPSNRSYAGKYRYETLKLPVLLEGLVTINPHPDGCVHRVDIDVQCGIPLIGKFAEQVMADRVRRELAADLLALERWLEKASTPA